MPRHQLVVAGDVPRLLVFRSRELAPLQPVAEPSASSLLAPAILNMRYSSIPSCGSMIGMFSRWASSSTRASTWSRLGTRPSRYACSSSVTSAVLIATPQELIEQGLEGDHIFGHARDRVVEHDVIQPRGRHGLVQPGPAAIPWLELGPRPP